MADYEIKEVEAFRNKHAPPAFYYPPAADGSRGGIFYANTYLPETRGKYVMESIALHEAIPGHHFQIALAQELENLPFLRKQANDFTTAYIGMCVYARLRASACASACACVCTRARAGVCTFVVEAGTWSASPPGPVSCAHTRAHTHICTHTNMHTEGWGLYTEYLGTELGFYTDPAQDFGRLTTEMMRAVRLVIDTGTYVCS